MNINNFPPTQDKYAISTEMEAYMTNYSTQTDVYVPSYTLESPTQVFNASQMSSQTSAYSFPPSPSSYSNSNSTSYPSHSSAGQEATEEQQVATVNTATTVNTDDTTDNACADSEEQQFATDNSATTDNTVTTENANKSTRTFLTLEEEIAESVVSDQEWILVIQEKMKVLEKTSILL